MARDDVNARQHAPKNIVLFSDGTGNSASKPFKTNVWRTYQALDLEPPNGGAPLQIAYYRDGVGTETFKPLALLGGAFGFGVMRDVRALYTFLCRNYRPGDRIFAFGFSRGAFTIRLLVRLVAKCGLVQASDENQLFHAVSLAYKAFRRDFLIAASEPRGMIYNYVLAPPCYKKTDPAKVDLHLPREPEWPNIAFLGLWDTVDAYGMPVDELKQGIDEWIWPMSLADRKLSPIVEKACHALSLDDERPTFRPLVWDERASDDRARIKQVWFAGVHANVGGGYPIDDLSYVPLDWMLQEAAVAGLRFDAEQVAFYRHNKNPHGTSYDSRSGVAGYYRYGPRSLEKLCDDRKNDVWIDPPQIHPSVCERIARRRRTYAPVSLPRTLELTKPGTDKTVPQDGAFLDLAWDAVFWRRVVYFATVFVTVAFVLLPAFTPTPDPIDLVQPHASISGEPPRDGLHRVLLWLPRAYLWVLDKIASFLPGWFHPWGEAIKAFPKISGLLALAFIWLFFIESSHLRRVIEDRSEWAWAAMKENVASIPYHSTFGDRLVRRLRFSDGAASFAKGFEWLVPHAVGLILLLLILATCALVPILAILLLRGPLLWFTTGLAFVATVGCFLRNAPLRNEIDRALRAVPGEPTRVPERQWTYSAEDLERFRTKASGIEYADRLSALEAYHSPILLPNDFAFSIAMGCFVALLGLTLKIAVPGLAPWFVASAICGLLYAAADVSEDMALAQVMGSKRVTPALALTALLLTRAKMLFLTLSVTGVALFLLLSLVGARMPPKVPTRN